MTNVSMRGEKRQLASTRSHQARWEAKESFPAKLDLINEKLAIRDRVKGETVAIKMHTGNNLSYSTVHPVFVRKVVQAVKEGGGKPFNSKTNLPDYIQLGRFVLA